MCPRQSTKLATMKTRPRWPDSHNSLSDEPGTLQWSVNVELRTRWPLNAFVFDHSEPKGHDRSMTSSPARGIPDTVIGESLDGSTVERHVRPLVDRRDA